MKQNTFLQDEVVTSFTFKQDIKFENEPKVFACKGWELFATHIQRYFLTSGEKYAGAIKQNRANVFHEPV